MEASGESEKSPTKLRPTDRLFYLFAAVLLCGILPSPCLSDELLHLAITSDIHGWMSTKYIHPGRKAKGLLHLADAIREARQRHPDTILLDSGDLLSGSPLLFYFNWVQEDPVSGNLFFDLFNSLGYDAVSVGNHDLDIYPQLMDAYLPNAEFPMLAANLVEEGTAILQPYVVLKRGQLSIAILGLTTTGSMMWNRLAGSRSAAIESIESALHAWLSVMQKRERPDLTVGLFHIGLNPLRDDENSKIKRIPPANELRTVLDGIENLDLVISGHDHRLNPYRSGQEVRRIHGIPVVSAGHGGEALLKLKLRVVRRSKKWKIDHIETQAIRADQADRLSGAYAAMLPDRYKSYIQAELPWRIQKTGNRQASACFDQLLAKANSRNGIHATMFPKTNVKGIGLRRGKRLNRADLFRWFRYHNRPVAIRMSRRDIHLLRHPRAEYGKWRVAYNRKLFFWSDSGLESDTGDYWWPSAEAFERRFLVKVGDYHAFGGGGLLSGLFFQKENFEELSPSFLKDTLFRYLSTGRKRLPRVCSFLKPDR